MAFINHKIYSLPEDFQLDLRTIISFVEDWNKQDKNKEVADASARVLNILWECDKDKERGEIIDNLTDAQEDKLKEACMKDYHGDKEHWEDAYERFIEDLSLEDLKKII